MALAAATLSLRHHSSSPPTPPTQYYDASSDRTPSEFLHLRTATPTDLRPHSVFSFDAFSFSKAGHRTRHSPPPRPQPAGQCNGNALSRCHGSIGSPFLISDSPSSLRIYNDVNHNETTFYQFHRQILPNKP